MRWIAVVVVLLLCGVALADEYAKSGDKLSITKTVTNSGVISKDEILSIKANYQKEIDKMDALLAECDKLGIKSNAELAAEYTTNPMEIGK